MCDSRRRTKWILANVQNNYRNMTDCVNRQVESSTPSDQQQRRPDSQKLDDDVAQKDDNWLSDDEKFLKIRFFVLTQSTNVTDGQTDRHTPHAGICHIASRGNKISICLRCSAFVTVDILNHNVTYLTLLCSHHHLSGSSVR